MGKTTNKFSPEIRERAVRMVLDHQNVSVRLGWFSPNLLVAYGPQVAAFRKIRTR